MGRTKALIFVGLAFLSATAPARAQFLIEGQFPVESGVTLEQLHAAVSAELLDPRSAQYKGLVYADQGRKKAVCGWVNSRNSAGGYEAFRPFAYLPRGNVVVFDAGFVNVTTGKPDLGLLEFAGCSAASLGLPE